MPTQQSVPPNQEIHILKNLVHRKLNVEKKGHEYIGAFSLISNLFGEALISARSYLMTEVLLSKTIQTYHLYENKNQLFLKNQLFNLN